jgi:FKBP-type peptidyl-prolyl cis-trans isomerase
MRIFNFLILILLFGSGMYSCKKTTSQMQRDEEVANLRKYVTKYLPGIKPTPSGLYFKEIQPGNKTHDSIRLGDIVKVYYSGYLIDASDSVKEGNFFDGTGNYLLHTGNYEPFIFTVGSSSVISGWNEAIQLMKTGEGETALWVLPSRLAYSGQTQSEIPPYSPLVFYVTLVQVYHMTNDSNQFKPFPVDSKKPF